MNPKFSAGEVVILQSINRPEYNGEYEVTLIVPMGGVFIDPHYGVKRTCGGPGIGYILSDPRLITGLNAHEPVCVIWDERALRKKHQPGELSYSELLESLTVKSGAPA